MVPKSLVCTTALGAGNRYLKVPALYLCFDPCPRLSQFGKSRSGRIDFRLLFLLFSSDLNRNHSNETLSCCRRKHRSFSGFPNTAKSCSVPCSPMLNQHIFPVSLPQLVTDNDEIPPIIYPPLPILMFFIHSLLQRAFGFVVVSTSNQPCLLVTLT